jgi:OPT oligopeptide transporter protein
MPITFAIQYGLSFASIPAVVIHCILYHGKDIKARFMKSRTEPLDIHGKLYARYKDAPAWWFVVMLVISLILGILSVVITPLIDQMPVWSFLFSLLISFLFIIPLGIIFAITVSQP